MASFVKDNLPGHCWFEKQALSRESTPDMSSSFACCTLTGVPSNLFFSHGSSPPPHWIMLYARISMSPRIVGTPCRNENVLGKSTNIIRFPVNLPDVHRVRCIQWCRCAFSSDPVWNLLSYNAMPIQSLPNILDVRRFFQNREAYLLPSSRHARMCIHECIRTRPTVDQSID